MLVTAKEQLRWLQCSKQNQSSVTPVELPDSKEELQCGLNFLSCWFCLNLHLYLVCSSWQPLPYNLYQMGAFMRTVKQEAICFLWEILELSSNVKQSEFCPKAATAQ